MPKSSIEIPTPSLRKIGRISSWKWVLATKASSVTSIMKRSGKPVASSASANERMNSRIAGLLRRDVDADGGVVAEGFVDEVDRLDDLGQHQMGQLVDQSRFHGEIDEGAGGLNDALVVAQAHQRLDALDLLGPDVDLGLERAAKAFFQNGEPQRLLDLHPRQRLALHAGVEEGRRALAVVLDAVHRDIGVLAQHVVAAAVLGIEADPDRGRGENLRSVDEERGPQPLQREADVFGAPRLRSGSG